MARVNLAELGQMDSRPRNRLGLTGARPPKPSPRQRMSFRVRASSAPSRTELRTTPLPTLGVLCLPGAFRVTRPRRTQGLARGRRPTRFSDSGYVGLRTTQVQVPWMFLLVLREALPGAVRREVQPRMCRTC